MQRLFCLRHTALFHRWATPPQTPFSCHLCRYSTRTAGTSEAAPITPSSLTSSTLAELQLAASPAPLKTTSDVATAFAYMYNDVFTTVDIAPVKRPQLIGSLLCAVDDYPFSVFLVEECTGTTMDGVTQSVHQHAVRAAEHIRGSTGLSVRAFLIQHVCESRPEVMRHLRSLDLSLQLRLVVSETIGRSEKGADESAARPSPPLSTLPPVAQWYCAASLYDPWQTQPQFTPLRFSHNSKQGCDAEGKLCLEGELQTVLADVMTRVEEELSARCAALVHEGADEAALYTREVGGAIPQRWLTSALQYSALQSLGFEGARDSGARSSATYASRNNWGWENFSTAAPTLLCSSWELSCACWTDTSTMRAVGVNVSLAHVVREDSAVRNGFAAGAAAARGTPPSRVVLAEAQANCTLVPLVDDLKSEAGSDVCVYVNDSSAVNAGFLQEAVLTTTELTARLSSGTITRTSDWINTPLRVCSYFIEQAALLAPAVACDWLGGERWGETNATTAGENPQSHRTTRMPDIVQWTSFEGRSVVDTFVDAAAAAATEISLQSIAECEEAAAASRHWLPPLWPRVTPSELETTACRLSAFRELIRSDLGLRYLPRRAFTATLPGGEPNVVFVCDAEVVVGWEKGGSTSSTAFAEATRLRVGTAWYADVAAAAQALTPWALPLCCSPSAENAANSIDTTTATPTAAGAGEATGKTATSRRAVRKSERKVAKLQTLSVMSISDSLTSSGVSHATWNPSANELVCFTADRNHPPLRFPNMNTVDGLVALMQFCSKTAVHVNVFVKADPDKWLSVILRLMMRAGASPGQADVKRSLNHSRSSGHNRGGNMSAARSNGEVASVVDSEEEDACFIAVLPLPFQAGTVRLLASSRMARAGEVRRLLTFLQHYSTTPLFFIPLLASAPPANLTFFHVWNVTAPWVHPRGPLRVSLTVDDVGSLPDGRSGRRKEEEKDEAAFCSCQKDRPTAFILCIDTADGAISVDSKTTSAESQQQRRRVCLPTDGRAWISEAYAAFRAALLSLPGREFTRCALVQPSCSLTSLLPMKQPHEQHTSDDTARLLVQCSTFTQLLYVALCVAINRRGSHRNFLLTNLLFSLFGNQVEYSHHDGVRELRVQVTPDASVRLAAFSEQRPDIAQIVRHRGWRESLCHIFFEGVAPEFPQAVALAQRIHDVWFASTLPQRRVFADSIELHVSWKAQPTVCSAAEAVDTTLQLHFIARALGVAKSSPATLSPSLTDSSTKPVLFEVSGDSLTDVLQRLLADSLPTAFEQFQAPHPALALLALRNGFLEAARRTLSQHYQLERVTVRYDELTGKLSVLGWKHTAENEMNRSVNDSPVLLAREKAAWACVPQIVFRLHRQLLHGIGEKAIETDVDTLMKFNKSGLREKICASLGCRAAVLDTEHTFHNNVWCCTVTLPSNLFQFDQLCTKDLSSSTASASTPPSNFYVTCLNAGKKKAEKYLLACMCHWTCYASTEKVDYKRLYGVQCMAKAPVFSDASAATGHPTCVARYCGQNSERLGSRSNKLPVSASPPAFSSSHFPSPPSLFPPSPSSASAPTPRLGKAFLHAPSAAPAPGAVGGNTARVSLLECTHTKVRQLLGELVDVADGHVVLKLSQTFGMELMYEVAASRSSNAAGGDGAVQLLREAWIPTTWAPAQILRAEAAVLSRLVCRDASLSANQRLQRLQAVLTEVLRDDHLLPLRCGPDVSRKDFCVRFLRRYFGWRVCEQADLADLPVDDAHSSIVVYESVVTAAGSASFTSATARRRCTTRPMVSRASLCLGQIVSPGESSVHLAQVLAQVEEADAENTRALLWDACARHVKEVFGVSRLMTTAEVDAGMFRFITNNKL